MPVQEVDVSALSPGTRLTLARLLIRILRGLGLLLMAAWSLLILAWATVHWFILPHIDQWRGPIERQATQLLGQPVRIGSVRVTSSALVPAIELKDVVLLDAQSQPALRLPRVVAALSVHSLLSLEPRFAQLLIDGAHLEVHRDAAGRLFVAGLDFSGPGRNDRAPANWFFKQHEFVIRGGSVRWTDELHPAPPLALSDVQLVVRNSLRHHDLRIDATPPAAWGERVSVTGRFTQPLLAESADWRRWRGTVYASLPDADVRTLRQHATLPFDLTQGQGALRAWVDVMDGQATAVTLDVALRDVALRLQPDLDPLGCAEVTGSLGGRSDDRDTELAARQFGFVTADGVRWPASNGALKWRRSPGGDVTGGELTAERLDLGLMTQVARRLPVGDAAHRLLADFEPRGTATALSLRWDGEPVAALADATAPAASAASAVTAVLPPRYQVRAHVSGLSLAAAPAADTQSAGRPGVRQAEVQLTADQSGGEARITMTQGAFDLPGVLEDPLLPFDRLSANLNWRVEASTAAHVPPQVTVVVKDAQFANADLQGELHGTWATGPATTIGKHSPRYPGRLDLDAKLTQVAAARVYRYLPLGVSGEARHYVEHAVRGGRVASATFRVKGDLNDFPFADGRAKDSEFRIAAQVDKATFAYVPSWPATATEPAYVSTWPLLDELSGELVFDRASMEIRNAQARVQGVKLTGVQGGIKTLADKSELVLEGAGRGAAADLLHFVNASPVGGWTGNALAHSTASGNADLKLALSVPLSDPAAATVRGNVTLTATDFRLRPDTPLVGAARGRIDFSQKGFSIVGASGRLLGGDLSVDGGQQPDGSMRFIGQGIATAEGLRRGSDVGGAALARLANSLTGQVSYRVALNLVRGQSDLIVTSNLVGLASELPAPLNKAADAPLALRFQNAPVNDVGGGVGAAGATATQDVIRLDLGNLLQVQYVRDVSGAVPRVLRGGLGVMAPAPNPASGVTATLNLASLNVDAWEQVAAGLAEAGAGDASRSVAAATIGPSAGDVAAAFTAYLPTTIGLRAQEVQSGSRHLSRVVAGLSQEGSVWRVNLDSDQASGYIEYRAPRGSAGNSPAAVTNAAAAGRVYARLSRLSLPKDDVTDVESLLDQPAAQSVPALDIVVDDLELRGKRLGRMELEASNRPGAREWRLTRLALTTPEAKLTASGNWAALGVSSGAAASTATSAARRVVLSFKLELSDSGALVDRLGFGKVVRGGKGGLSGQVAWLGSPLSLDYPSLTGQINISIAAGQFLKAEPGVGRLLSVLSLQALPRRLVLDFRDVFQQGFAFDDISGDVQIMKGVAQTNNLRMRGVQAAVLMEGQADIEQETQDLRVIVVPEIDAGTASLAYAAINPALGLGAFLAQALFSKPLIAVNTREFHITGTWADPKVDKVDRKFGAPVPDIPAPSSSMPSSAPAASANEPTPKP
ncbi:MAG: YhdP family protein [Burkholderiaceae bacterium]|nr:YhdP family protein [Burkholderiaceae bacterium]